MVFLFFVEEDSGGSLVEFFCGSAVFGFSVACYLDYVVLFEGFHVSVDGF